MSDDMIEQGGYVSPPIRVAVASGYRVGTSGDLTNRGLLCYTDIIENSTGNVIAMSNGREIEESEQIAKMIVAALNRVPV